MASTDLERRYAEMTQTAVTQTQMTAKRPALSRLVAMVGVVCAASGLGILLWLLWWPHRDRGTDVFAYTLIIAGVCLVLVAVPRRPVSTWFALLAVAAVVVPSVYAGLVILTKDRCGDCPPWHSDPPSLGTKVPGGQPVPPIGTEPDANSAAAASTPQDEIPLGPAVDLRAEAGFVIPSHVPGKCVFDYRSSVVAVDAATGAQTWSQDVPFVWGADMVIASDSVVVVAPDQATDQYVVYAMDLSGQPLWSRLVPRSELLASEAGDLLVISPSGVHLLDPSDGTSIWDLWAESRFFRSLLDTTGERLFVQDGGTVVSVDVATGARLWSESADADPEADGSFAPILDPSSGTIISGGWPATAISLKSDSGARWWRWDAPQGYHISEELLVDDGIVVLPMKPFAYQDFDGLYVALNAETGQELWSNPITDRTSYIRNWIAHGKLIEVHPDTRNNSGFVSYDLMTGAAEITRVDGYPYDFIVTPVGSVALLSQPSQDHGYDSRSVTVFDMNLEAVWTADMPQAQSVAAVDQSLIIAGGERDQPGFVAKYELATGTLDWRADYVRSVAAPPVFVRDLAIALASDPVLFCD